jgi:DNA repair exonuclease SbcCD ATPase subunit
MGTSSGFDRRFLSIIFWGLIVTASSAFIPGYSRVTTSSPHLPWVVESACLYHQSSRSMLCRREKNLPYVRLNQPFPKNLLFKSKAADDEDTATTASSLTDAKSKEVDETKFEVKEENPVIETKKAEQLNGNNPLANFFKFPPHPPETLPPAYSYQELLKETDASATTVAELENRLLDLQRELAQKEAALTDGQSYWMKERSSLMDKVNEFSNMLQDKEEIVSESEQRREQLEREVSLLQGQLPQVQNMLRVEQQRAEELRDRLSDVEDTMEYQQMEFGKEKQELQDTLDKEKQRLQEIENAWAREKTRFGEERTSVEQQLQEEVARLEASEAEIIRVRESYQRERDSLEAKLEKKRLALEENEEALQLEKKTGMDTKAALVGEVSTTRTQLRKAEDFLAEAQKLFQKTETELKENLRIEQDNAAKLNKRLDEELELFQANKKDLENRIKKEQEMIREVEEQLRAERLEYAKEKVRLEFELEEEGRIRKLKKKQMKNRYDQIRKELTTLWEGAKRNAREEISRLTKKYEAKLSAVSEASKKLEEDLNSARLNYDDLSRVLEDVKRQKDTALKRADGAEARYLGSLADLEKKDSELQNLEADLRTKNEQLHLYQNSYRKLFRASLTLTGSRLQKTGSRVTGIFRRRK